MIVWCSIESAFSFGEEENIKIYFPKFCKGFMTMTKVEENSKEGKKKKETY